MDSSDPKITLDDYGYCNHCTKAFEVKKSLMVNIETNPLDEVISKIKLKESKNQYDGIMGISGGVDSSYLMHLLSQYKLRLLLVHVDAGWNSAIAVMNIQKLASSLNLDLETIVIDWDSMRNLQIAFLKSGVLNQDVPQDHAFFASLYGYALKHGIRNIFTGTNAATESIGPESWSQYAMDGRNLRSIYKKFGPNNTLDFPIFSIPRFYLHRFITKRFEVVMPLNHVQYSKKTALSELRELYDWDDYGGKHRESMFTSFYQDVYMVERYGIDKRKAHLSDLIINGEISREEALTALTHPASSPIERQNLIDYVASKLEITPHELEDYITIPMTSNLDFGNDMWFIKAIAKTYALRRFLKKFLPKRSRKI